VHDSDGRGEVREFPRPAVCHAALCWRRPAALWHLCQPRDGQDRLCLRMGL